ncbi:MULTISPECIES: ABC transporter substrate-binding protein [Halomonadaceae]|uniref:ABC transporter substrate-binding protein n=1 Tax=Halomonadaceae TaxID=28256 RepID=UPI00159B48F4|nr:MULTISPECIES: ABC transporter substrate-binding protein [Halomonas]QJQ96226.1 ABC transporter substrate-binding protein [Halomonas sp. PA5]
MSCIGSRLAWLPLLALLILSLAAPWLVAPISSEAIAEATDEMSLESQPALPASQRDPIPQVEAPFWQKRSPKEHAGALSEAPFVPSVTLREPEPIAPPPLSELHIVLDWYLSPQHASLLIARKLGYFEKQGLNVRITVPADPSVPTKLLAASRIDLALGRQPQLHMQVDQGLPLIRVATLIGRPLVMLTVRQDSDIETPAQLEGRSIGYAVDDTNAILEAMLSQFDFSLGNITLHNLNFALSQALVQQHVDAVIAPMRHTLPLQLEEEGIVSRSFLAEEHGYPLHDGLIMMANRDHLATKRSEIQRLLVALEEANLWMLNHPDDAWRRLVDAEPGLDTTVNRRAWRETLSLLAQRPSALEARRYETLDAYLHEHGHIASRSPVERLAVDLHSR